MIRQLIEKTKKDSEFFYHVKLNDQGPLASLFWYDFMMWKGYIISGDVVIFDTSYRTN